MKKEEQCNEYLSVGSSHRELGGSVAEIEKEKQRLEDVRL